MEREIPVVTTIYVQKDVSTTVRNQILHHWKREKSFFFIKWGIPHKFVDCISKGNTCPTNKENR